MPEAPAAKIETEDKAVESIPDSEEQESSEAENLAAEEQVKTVEVKEKKILGLGLMGTTGVMLAIIILLVVLGTVALSPRRKSQL
jgi:hypothetical protein